MLLDRALRRGAVWSEVKEEGRNDPTLSALALNRPGGHERNTAHRRSALAQTDACRLRTTATGRDRTFAGSPANVR